ncbi:MAG: hypothetical protein AABX13_01485 [Nanoarchaeota archaeon]
MSLPPHEIVYAPNGDISYVKMYSPAGDSLRESIYEQVYAPPQQRKTRIYMVQHRDQKSGSSSTGTAQHFSDLPPLIQRIFQRENRSELEAFVKSGGLAGFVIKP